jgi:hypothetical protein
MKVNEKRTTRSNRKLQSLETKFYFVTELLIIKNYFDFIDENGRSLHSKVDACGMTIEENETIQRKLI